MLVCRDVASGADRHLDITFRLQVVESSSLVSEHFREAFNHPYITSFHLLVNCLFPYFFREPLTVFKLVGVSVGEEELKWHQLAHNQLMSRKDLILVHTVQLKPILKTQISGKLVSTGISDVAFISVSSEKTHMKKCWIMIIIITRKMVPITRRASFPNKKMLYSLINNKPILIHSMLAASIVQDTFAREAVENEGG